MPRFEPTTNRSEGHSANPYTTDAKGSINSEDAGKFYGLKKIFQKALLNYYIQ